MFSGSINPGILALAIGGHSTYLLLCALGTVVLLVLLIARYKLNPFLVLVTLSLLLGTITGIPLLNVVKSFEAGVGTTLGHIAIVIALGTMLGKMMAESGGAERIALTVIDIFGEDHLPWAMVFIGFIVGLPVFFEVGIVLLMPVVFTVARRTGKSLVLIGLPLTAGLSVVHGLVPPHPAAMLAVTSYNADIGRTIFYGLVVGLPSAILAGPVFSRFISPWITLDAFNPIEAQLTEIDPSHTLAGTEHPVRNLPGFGITLCTVMLPVLLMLIGSAGSLVFSPQSHAGELLRLIGGADMALLISVLVSFVTLGTMRGFNRESILRFSTECVAPTAMIILLIGAGGGFGRILQDSGTSQAVVDLALGFHVPLIILAWLLAALVRLATGSATVAMTTAAGIVAPIAIHTPGVHPELMALATGAGSLIFSHVNDGGFWIVKSYFNMSVAQTLKSWSILETIISIASLILILGLSLVL